MSFVLEIRLDPLDPLLFGDNRSARAGEDHELSDQDPTPATFYGAIGARIAASLGATGESGDWARAEPVLGPFHRELAGGPKRAGLLGFAATDPEGRSWFPKPAHLWLEGLETASGVEPVSGRLLGPAPEREQLLSSLPEGMRRVTAPGGDLDPRAEEAEGLFFLDERRLAEVLEAPEGFELEPDDLRSGLRRPEAFQCQDYRIGLAMDNRTNTAVEGRLFSRPYRRFREGFVGESLGTAGFRAWLEVRDLDDHDPADWDAVGFLGGDRRRVEMTHHALASDRPLPDLLAEVSEGVRGTHGYIAYLLTPAVITGPDLVTELELDGRRPVAAALGRPVHASGWRAWAGEPGPRPIRTLLPAGSVVFYDWDDSERSEEARRERLASLWFTSLCPDFEFPGFGRILAGLWR